MKSCNDFYCSFVKPLMDVLMACILLFLTSPVLLLASLGLVVSNKGKIWFLQKRPGKDGRIFTIIKFKTMNDAADSTGNLLPDKDRLTDVGRMIRATSLDELPQLFNVLKGDMSIVGPRPLLVEYLPLYDDFQKKRHRVKPGITGWAQVNGRNAVSWEHRFEMDVWYVEHLTFLLDLRILFLTIIKVLRAEGISGENTATMTKFRGTTKQG